MFGPMGGAVQQYLKIKQYKRRNVTRAEFIAAAMADGMTPQQAKLQAKLSKHMGSAVLIGDELLTVTTKAKAGKR
ncbi:MAG TPA: hypothetical protein VEA69_00410 [Tepidisphaeraceae bacterium]|nr:hypothetical protein [Tepidisphaeraceae bacterium]